MAITPPEASAMNNRINNGAGMNSSQASPMSPPDAAHSNALNNGAGMNGSGGMPMAPPNAGLKFNAATSKMPIGNAAVKPSAGVIPVNPGQGGGGNMSAFYKRS